MNGSLFSITRYEALQGVLGIQGEGLFIFRDWGEVSFIFRDLGRKHNFLF